MPWKHDGKIIKIGTGWSDGEFKYPNNWVSWSDEKKAEIGLVWEDDPAPVDNRFYWDAKTPKSLSDVNSVDDDDNPLLDENGNQVVNLGLKSTWKAIIKKQAAELLQPTDWYVIRKSEDDTATIPSDVSTYRAAVRTKSGTIEAAIDGAKDHAAFMALFEVPTDSKNNPTGKAPSADWPASI